MSGFNIIQGVIFLADKLGKIVGTKRIGAEVATDSSPLYRAATDAVLEGVLDDTSTVAAVEDLPAPVRITPQRALHVNLRDASGGELGAASASGVFAKILGKKADNSFASVAIDDEGRIYMAPGTLGTKMGVVRGQVLAANAVDYHLYTVPAGVTLEASKFYAGGASLGKAALVRRNTAVTSLIANGDFESGADVTAWAVGTGSFTAPSPDSSTVQKTTGSASMRWIYSGSSTAALKRVKTFTPTLDTSGYRYMTVWFFNDGATGTTRTISIVLTSGTSTRTYSLTGTLGTAPMLSNTWTKLTADLESPTASGGSTYDSAAVTSIALQMLDGANKTGTVYWDQVQFEESLTVSQRVYFAAGTTSIIDITPTSDFMTGEQIYLITVNLGSKGEFTTVLKGTLV